MLWSMSINIDTTTTTEFIPTPLSIRSDQKEWLDAEAMREMHADRLPRANRSRIVQEALDLLRDVRNGDVFIVDPRKKEAS